MNTRPNPTPSRVRLVAAGAIGVGAAAVIAVTAFALPAARQAPGAEAPSTTPSTTVTATAAAAPSPQPTKTAEIDDTLVVRKELTAEVTKVESVEGVAEGPGEIAGPSIRVTVALHNTTGAAVNLSNTVVNAYYGAKETPAVPLLNPGGRSFPASVADEATATGVFVFTVPESQRALVKVTVDTSVKNAVVAFTGPAPR